MPTPASKSRATNASGVGLADAMPLVSMVATPFCARRYRRGRSRGPFGTGPPPDRFLALRAPRRSLGTPSGRGLLRPTPGGFDRAPCIDLGHRRAIGTVGVDVLAHHLAVGGVF